MKVAIAGAGSVGTAIAGDLHANGHEVLLFERDPDLVERLRPSLDITWIAADACEVSSLHAAHLDEVDTGRRGAHRAVCGLDLGDERVLRRMNAIPGGVARSERDDRRTGVDHETDPAAVDASVNLEVPARVARDDHRSRIRRVRRNRRQRAGGQRERRRICAHLGSMSRHEGCGAKRKDSDNRDSTHEISWVGPAHLITRRRIAC